MIENRASILAIGTELTTGQITNRNAAWISGRLVAAGVEVVLHETVPDDRGLIRSALDRCYVSGRLIFVTGGLGPTTDDFTREVISEWTGQPLEFFEPSWLKIQSRLSRLGIPVASSNRQQCFHPRGAQVLANAQGTADGFSLERGEAKLWVLPGPPREIEAIWNDCELDAAVRSRLPPGIQRMRLLSWECLGKSEAELGEIVEKTLEGIGLRTGYRAHRPYVEVKVWIPETDLVRHDPALRRLEDAIAPWVMVKQGEDLATQLLDLLRFSEEIEIADSCSAGLLLERLGVLLRKPQYCDLAQTVTFATEWTAPEDPSHWVDRALEQADEEVLTLAIAGMTHSGEWALGLRHGAIVRQETMQSPYGRGGMDAASEDMTSDAKSARALARDIKNRSRAFTVEMALKRWRDWLKVTS